MPSNEALLRYAIERGYRVVDGDVWHPNGERPVRLRLNPAGYQRFGVHSRTRRLKGPVLVHRLAAWQKFGEALFHAKLVRHLDGNRLNNAPENLALGTDRDNFMDQPPPARRARARRAASGRRKLTQEQAEQLRRDREAGATYAVLMERYGITKAAVSYIVNGKTYVT